MSSVGNIQEHLIGDQTHPPLPKSMGTGISTIYYAVTRAVHIEVVLDLAEVSFFQTFRRFVSRRSLPYTMISTNASTYQSAAEELKQ